MSHQRELPSTDMSAASHTNRHYIMLDVGDERLLPVLGSGEYRSTDESIAIVMGGLVLALADGDCLLIATNEQDCPNAIHVTVGWQVQNPVLPNSWQMFVADGEAHSFNDQVYVYGSLDGADGVFCSSHYMSLTSSDMMKWEAQGFSFSSSWEGAFPGRILWDPDGSHQDGRYQLYGFYEWDPESENNTFVLEADNPMGPFSGFKWLIGDRTGRAIDAISASVLVDDDGSRYIAYAPTLQPVHENYPVIARLIDPATVDESTVVNLGPYVPNFYEGPSLRKRGDTYYFVYVENLGPITESNRTPVRLSYATSKSPLGEYTYRGTIISLESIPGNENIHGSIEVVDDVWYVFYHRAPYSQWNRRALCVERIAFDSEGLILPVAPSSSGVSSGLSTSKPIYVSSAVIQNSCRFSVDFGTFGSALIDGQGELGFRWVSLAGNEKELVLAGDGLDEIVSMEVLADGVCIGRSRGSATVGLLEVPCANVELLLRISTSGETHIESVHFSQEGNQ